MPERCSHASRAPCSCFLAGRLYLARSHWVPCVCPPGPLVRHSCSSARLPRLPPHHHPAGCWLLPPGCPLTPRSHTPLYILLFPCPRVCAAPLPPCPFTGLPWACPGPPLAQPSPHTLGVWCWMRSGGWGSMLGGAAGALVVHTTPILLLPRCSFFFPCWPSCQLPVRTAPPPPSLFASCLSPPVAFLTAL